MNRNNLLEKLDQLIFNEEGKVRLWRIGNEFLDKKNELKKYYHAAKFLTSFLERIPEFKINSTLLEHNVFKFIGQCGFGTCAWPGDMTFPIILIGVLGHGQGNTSFLNSQFTYLDCY